MTTTPAPSSLDACTPTTSAAIDTAAAATVATVLKAIADPFRLRMLSAIAMDPRGESCVCDLAELSDVSQPTVSHHLKVLKDTGMLHAERRGTWVWYRIAPARRTAVTALLDGFAPAAVLGEGGADVDPGDQDQASADSWVSHLAEELADDYGSVDRDLVVVIVRESYAALARTATVTRYLIPLAERFARQRLADLSRDRDTAAPQVLFVCVQNAGRSQLAAALVNKLSDGKVVARSAGSSPASQVHPHVHSMLKGIAGEQYTSEVFPKPLTDDAVRAADVVVTMGCGDICPIIPGVRYEQWAVGDPSLATGDEAESIRSDIESHVRDLLGRLNS